MRPMREWCRALGHEWIEYVDQASAKDFKRRTAWSRLLTDARTRKIDLLVTWKLDRAFRSSQHADNVMNDLTHWGVGFRCHTQEIDSTSATGRLLFAILAAVAEMEHDLISERVKEGMDRARSEGKHVGRPARRRQVASHPRFAAVAALVYAKQLSVKAGAKALGVNEHAFRTALVGSSAPSSPMPGEGALAQ
jgi:DNA invertase Pin-like site-specific DNA recombinase